MFLRVAPTNKHRLLSFAAARACRLDARQNYGIHYETTGDTENLRQHCFMEESFHFVREH